MKNNSNNKNEPNGSCTFPSNIKPLFTDYSWHPLVIMKNSIVIQGNEDLLKETNFQNPIQTQQTQMNNVNNINNISNIFSQSGGKFKLNESLVCSISSVKDIKNKLLKDKILNQTNSKSKNKTLNNSHNNLIYNKENLSIGKSFTNLGINDMNSFGKFNRTTQNNNNLNNNTSNMTQDRRLKVTHKGKQNEKKNKNKKVKKEAFNIFGKNGTNINNKDKPQEDTNLNLNINNINNLTNINTLNNTLNNTINNNLANNQTQTPLRTKRVYYKGEHIYLGFNKPMHIFLKENTIDNSFKLEIYILFDKEPSHLVLKENTCYQVDLINDPDNSDHAKYEELWNKDIEWIYNAFGNSVRECMDDLDNKLIDKIGKSSLLIILKII